MKKDNKPEGVSPNSNDAGITIHDFPNLAEWFGRLSERLSNSNPLRTGSLIVLLISVVAFYPTRYEDYDIWWHMALGRYYLQNFTMKIDHSIFSWTPADPGWIYNTWLGSTVYYIAYEIFGGFGLFLVQALVFASIALLVIYFIRSAGDRLDINYISGLLLLFAGLNLTAIYYKPEIFTTLCFALLAFVYFLSRMKSKKIFLLICPVLFVVWVNLHGGFLAGLLFMAVILAGEIIDYFFIRKDPMQKDMLTYLVISTAASFVAVLINPYGINYHISVLKGMFAQEYMGYATRVIAYQPTWKFLFPSQIAYRFIVTAWVIAIFAMTFTGLCLYAYRKKKYLNPPLIFANAVFLYFGMQTARYSLFSPILSFFSIVYILKKTDSYHAKAKFSIVSLVVFAGLSWYLLYFSLFYLDTRRWFGVGIEEGAPVGAVEYIKKNKLEGPLFNDYVTGGYMMWAMYPQYKVFIDPRYGPFWKQVGPDYFDFTVSVNAESLKKFVEKYPFKTALLNLREAPLIFFMVNTGDWRLVYFDKNAVVLINKALIPTLSREALATDVSTNRFRDLDDPTMLSNMFNFYFAIAPGYGKEILNIYKKNVSAYYNMKDAEIQRMEQLVNQKDLEIRQKESQMIQQGKKKARQ